jgi:hypothetical protein
MKPRNERTSKRIAAIAAKVMRITDKKSQRIRFSAASGLELVLTVGDLKALAASCLTQAPDKPKRKPSGN